MNARLFPLFLLLSVALLTSGCAATEESADDQMNTYQSTPEKPEDSHGWGANLQGMSGKQ